MTTHIRDLVPDPKNRRVHNARNIGMVADSLRQVGAARSIVIDEDNVILAGNGVTEAAAEAGITKVRVIDSDGDELIAVRRSGLTENEKRDLAISDNRANELSTWNVERLAVDGAALEKFFTDDELADLFKGPGAPKDGATDPDAVPAMRETSIQPGMVFALGQHRLRCGDAQSVEGLVDLLGGASDTVDLVMTSPPYNVGLKYRSHLDRQCRDEYLGFIEGTARTFMPHVKPGRFVAWNIGVSPKTFPAHQVVRLEACGLAFYREIVWQKSGIPYPVFPSTIRTKRARHYHPNYTHELIQIFEKPSGEGEAVACALCEGAGSMAARELPIAQAHDAVQLFTKGDIELGGPMAPDHRYRNDVWQIAQSQASVGLKTLGTRSTGLEHGGKRAHMVKEHPAAFPVELPRALMNFLTTPSEVVLDPFGGSGSTIMACEQLGRRGRLVELDPVYCQVIIDRWEAFTGQTAVKVGDVAA